MAPGSSWADDVKAYESSKKSLQFQPPEKPKFVSNFEKKREQREYDPLLQHYRDGSKESTLRDKENTKQKQAMQRAWANTIQREAPYNLINQQDKRKAKTPPKKADRPKPPGKESRVNYNLLNHERLPDRPPSPEKGESLVVREAHREYNILSNKYWAGHDERVAAEASAVAKVTKERYWKTHDLDVITQVFLDPEKEAATKAKEATRHESNAIRQAAGYPPAVALSEGQCYDITSGVIMDDDKHAFIQGKQDAKARRKAVGPKFEEAKRKLNEDEVKKQGDRLLHKGYARFQEQERRGFDILTNTGYQGLDGKPPVRPKMVAPRTLRDFVADDSNVGQPFNDTKRLVKEGGDDDLYYLDGGDTDSMRGEDVDGGYDRESVHGSEERSRIGTSSSRPDTGSSFASAQSSERGSTAASRRSSQHSLPPLSAGSHAGSASRLSSRHSQSTHSSRVSTARSARSQTASSRHSVSAHSSRSRQSTAAGSRRSIASAHSQRSGASVSIATPTSEQMRGGDRPASKASSIASSVRASTAGRSSQPQSTRSAGVSQKGSAASAASQRAASALSSRASKSRASLMSSSGSQAALSARIASSRASSRLKSAA